MTRIEEERIDEMLADKFGTWLATHGTPNQIEAYNDFFAREIEPKLKELRAQGGVRVAWQSDTIASLKRAIMDEDEAVRERAEDEVVTLYQEAVAPYAAALRMVREAIGELFGPVASIESEDATLLRGPEPRHEAEAQIAALHRVLSALETEAVESVAWVTRDILAAMKRGERVVPGWKRSADFCIPLYAHPPHSSIPTVTEDMVERACKTFFGNEQWPVGENAARAITAKVRMAKILKDATANLIAAAPEMLAALKVVIQHGRIDDSESRMNLVGAAIAKAEGKL